VICLARQRPAGAAHGVAQVRLRRHTVDDFGLPQALIEEGMDQRAGLDFWAE
jgi:hypothetical protein